MPGERNYRVPIPFTVWLQQKMPSGDTFVLFLACQPIGAKEVRSFTLYARNFGLDADDEVFIKFQLDIAEADRVVAESQRPEELPIDLREEMYVRGADAMSVEYRRWLLELVKESEALEA